MLSRFLAGSITLLCLSGCEKESGEAVVLAKEHIAAAVLSTATPAPETGVSPVGNNTSDEQLQPIKDDEITVDGYVMKPEVRGTSRDPRALKEEQWLAKVRMIEGGRTFNVHAEQRQFDRLKQGDRVQVSYRVGKYTNSIWSAEIKDR